MTLELQQDNIEHNEVVVETDGANFRRFVLISGSPDGKDWKPLVSGNVIHYTHGEQTLINNEFQYRNKPLTLGAVHGSAAAREIIFEQPDESKLPLKLYFGNQDAETANYDFARNLPEALPVVPVRATLGMAESNPQYVPSPKAFTERFPALIYIALGSVSLVLGAVIMNLSKAAIANHDTTSSTASP